MSTWEIISLSLLTRTKNLDTSKPNPQQFLLVMCDWTDNNDKENEDSQPPKKKMPQLATRMTTYRKLSRMGGAVFHSKHHS